MECGQHEDEKVERGPGLVVSSTGTAGVITVTVQGPDIVCQGVLVFVNHLIQLII